MLNDRGGQLVGEQVVVTHALDGGSGKVKHGDTEWLAKGPDAEPGTRMRVSGHDGVLLVEHLHWKRSAIDRQDHTHRSRMARKAGPGEVPILRQAGTERAFTGEYEQNKADGMYLCAGCGAPLFASDTKYNSGSGWPSYTAPVAERCGGGNARYGARHDPHRSALRQVRRPSRPRFPRWSGPEWPALLHQFRQPRDFEPQGIVGREIAEALCRVHSPCVRHERCGSRADDHGPSQGEGQ